uniref:Motility protein n=1 Tax=Rheinheimera sp. BAL341 TaxID=1708203 RepID=A0A486XLQ9_9GAMM
MSQSVGAAASNQGYEVLGAVMAKKQQNQEAKMATMLVQSAMQSVEQVQASSPVGNLGQNINISV